MKWSVTLTDRLGPEMLTVLEIKGQVLYRVRSSHSTNLFTTSCDHIFTNGKAPLHSYINHNNPQFLYSL